MAFEISNGTSVPHAVTYSDLLDKLVTFLVGTGVWHLHNDKRGTVGELTLRGEGLAGTENIYVGIKRYADVINDIYGWFLQGYTGFTDAGFNINPGAITGVLPVVNLWNSTIPYWLFANARRFIMVCKVDNVYIGMHAGHILPYGSPGHWFYPLCIGGTNVSNSFATTMTRYSDTSNTMCMPFVSQSGVQTFFSPTSSNLVMRTASGTWLRIYNQIGTLLPTGGSDPNDRLYTGHGIFPFCQNMVGGGLGINDGSEGYRQLRPNQATFYPLIPLRLLRSDTPDALGIFDGAYYVPGYNLSAEDIVQYGGDDYICFQDVFRTNLDSNFAIKKA